MKTGCDKMMYDKNERKISLAKESGCGAEVALAPIRKGDEERFRLLARQEHVLRFLPDMEMTPAYAARLAARSRDEALFSPCDQMRLFGIYAGDTLAGALTLGPVYEAGYRVTVGFFLGSDFLGQGIAEKAVRKALAIAREAGAAEAAALTECGNEPARKLLEKVGFREEKRLGIRRSGEREKRETIVAVYRL